MMDIRLFSETGIPPLFHDFWQVKHLSERPTKAYLEWLEGQGWVAHLPGSPFKPMLSPLVKLSGELNLTPFKYHKHPLKKALGKINKKTRVLDMNGGWGSDALLMASFGVFVESYEISPLLAFITMEGHALLRKNTESEHLEKVVFSYGDATEAEGKWEIIYIDPLFEWNRKAAPPKEAQVLQQWGHRESAQKLFDFAWEQDCMKVIIKRTPKAPYFLDKKPHHSVSSKLLRYDIYQK